MSLVPKIWSKLGRTNFTRVLNLALMLGLGSALGVGLLLWSLSSGLPDLDQLRDYQPRLTTRILDRNGELLTELFTERRLRVPLERVPKHTVDAILATEDARFWDHWGLDVIRIFGAALVDIKTLSLRQGASTVTQQLARDLYLHKRRSFARKLRETLTAIQIERNYSKQEILEMYLTQIYFGHGAYGVASAAARYFNKPVEQLTLAESALLAALPKAPNYYSPVFHPDRAKARRDLALRNMLKQGCINADEYSRTVAETLAVEPAPSEDFIGRAPYFTEMVRQMLSAEGERLGFDYLADGLEVHTTVDARLQGLAELAVDGHLDSMQTQYRLRFIQSSAEEVTRRLYSGVDENGDTIRVRVNMARIIADSARVDSLFPARAVLQVALVALDVQTGDVLAMIGGRDFRKTKFNRAMQAVRQPGSVFKPIVYTTAIDNGYPTTFQLLNQDVVLLVNESTRWVPQNYDGSHSGLTTLREALRRSLNLVTVRLVQEVVPPRMVRNYARQLGITTPIAAVDAIALGSSGVLPIEITASFGVFANGGVHSKPRLVTGINDRFGETISEYPVEQKVGLSAATAYIMTDLLRTCIDRGTGGGARWKHGFYKKAAGKTGTTNNFTDAWFVGFTPKLACGVWVGLDDPQETLGSGSSGAMMALPIWAKFMKMTYDSLGWVDEDFTIPPGVVRASICKETGMLAAPYCPVKVSEIFREDTRPTLECTKHRKIKGL